MGNKSNTKWIHSPFNRKSTNSNCIFLFITLLSGLLLVSSCARKTHLVLKLNIENKKYEHLSLFTHIEKSAGHTHGLEIPGTSKDGFNWTFIVPDSINHSVEGYFIRTQPFNFQKHEEKALEFSAKKISDRTFNVIILRDKITCLKGKYTHQASHTISSDLGYLLVDTFVIGATVTCDVIDLELKEKEHLSELEVQLSYPYFGDPDHNYTLDERLEIIKKHPYSISLLSTLPRLTYLLDKKELSVLFNAFSDQIRHSKDGQAIFDYINVEIHPTSIDTLTLVNSKNGNPEPIIKDHSKYTLVIFSASWCGPCHEQIPLLKEVFNHCGSKLDMVYISSDREKEEKAWNQLIEKNKIPWRSLFARDHKEGLYKCYEIEEIPHSLLVYPNGKIETIDVRYPSNKERLYKLMER